MTPVRPLERVAVLDNKVQKTSRRSVRFALQKGGKRSNGVHFELREKGVLALAAKGGG
jgi:hypothetical protein